MASSITLDACSDFAKLRGKAHPPLSAFARQTSLGGPARALPAFVPVDHNCLSTPGVRKRADEA
jgi:hypothetical protein